MPRPQKRWTPEEDTALAGMRAEGLTAKQIGRKLKRTRKSIYERVERKKIPKLLRRDVYLQLLRAGLSNLEVAARLAVAPITAATTRCELRRQGHDLPRLKRGPKPKVQ